MAVTGEAIKTSSKKKPRIAQEKRKGGFATSTTTGKSAPTRRNVGEAIMYLLIFGLVSILFLNFMGIIEIPFLQFLRPGGKISSSQISSSEGVSSQVKEEMALYQGPRLEVVNTPETSSLNDKPEIKGAESTPVGDDGVEVVVEGEHLSETSQVQETSSPSLPEKGSDEETASNPENVYRIAKIYSAMEPREAVQILEKFSDEEVVVILSAMKERQVAEILKAFPVERAAEIARKMMKGR
ncbi:MAG: hypothetical protein HPY68_07270 [Candidatus Atribacteria bacterium]|nr:hypothetical protein [Candidatus Atribacteria bacterium]